ncbi:MAG: DUF6660 family protein [Chitinophagales bacterium]
MKIIFAILSIVILYLGSAPCADAFHTHKENIEVATNGNEHHQENHEDLCPPFCSCNCCGNSVSTSNAFYQANLKLLIDSELFYSKDVSQFISRNFSSIWQPPKIV